MVRKSVNETYERRRQRAMDREDARERELESVQNRKKKHKISRKANKKLKNLAEGLD